MGVPGYVQGEFKSGSTQDLSTFFFNLQTPNLQVKIKNGISYQVSAWFMNIDHKCTLIRVGSFFLRHHVEVHLDLTRLCTAQTAEMEGN